MFVRLLDAVTRRQRFPITAFGVFVLLWAALFVVIAVAVGHISPVESYLFALTAIGLAAAALRIMAPWWHGPRSHG
jgi:hypothetical protein